MTPEKTTQALNELYGIILTSARSAGGGEYYQVRCDITDDALGYKERVEHLLYMCVEAKRLVADGRTEKAMRWLGFIQGSLWGMGLTSVDAMKQINRPDR